MLPASTDFKSAVINGGLFETNLVIKVFSITPDETGAYPVEFFITNTQIVSESMKLTQAICDETDLKFGGCIAGSFEIDISSSITDLTGRYITVDCSQKARDAQGNVYTFDCYLFSGEVFSCRYSKTRLTRKLIAYDRFYWRGQLNCAGVYSSLFSNGATVTLGTLRGALLSHFDIRQAANGSSEPIVPLPADGYVLKKDDDLGKSMTLSDALRMIGEMNGVFLMLNGHGDIEYITISGNPSPESYGYIYKSAEAEDFIRMGFDAFETYSLGVYDLIGIDQEHIYGLDNPLVTSGYQDPSRLPPDADNFQIALNAVKSGITPNFQISYRPFSMKTETRLWLQPGDRISFTLDWFSVTAQGSVQEHTQTVTSVLLSRRITGISAMTDELSAQGETDFDAESPAPPVSESITLTASDFIVGSIRGSTGGWMDSSTRIMCTTYFQTNAATTMTVEIRPNEPTKTMKWCVQGYYGYGHSGSNSSYEAEWTSATEYDLTELPADTDAIRIVVAFSNDADITPSDLSRFIFTLS